QPAREREDDQALRLRLPILTLARIDAHDPVQQPLGSSEQPVKERPLARVDRRHMTRQRDRERRQDRRETEDRQPAEERHPIRTSRRATTRTAGSRTRSPTRSARRDPRRSYGKRAKDRSHIRSIP